MDKSVTKKRPTKVTITTENQIDYNTNRNNKQMENQIKNKQNNTKRQVNKHLPNNHQNITQIGRFNPSNPIIVKYRNKDIINLVKEYTKEKLHKTNALAQIYIYIYIKLNMTMTATVHDTADNMTNTKLSILSLNINGLSEDKKRNKLFENFSNTFHK